MKCEIDVPTFFSEFEILKKESGYGRRPDVFLPDIVRKTILTIIAVTIKKNKLYTIRKKR